MLTLTKLLTEIKENSHTTTVVNALELLRFVKIPYNQKIQTHDTILDCAINNNNRIAKNRALICLADLEFAGDVVDKVVSVFRTSEDEWIRYGLYYFLCKSKFVNENIDVFLEGIEYIKESFTPECRMMRLGDEYVYLKTGLESVQTPKAIIKLLNYLIEHPKDLSKPYYENTIQKISINASNAFKQDDSIFDLMFDLITITSEQYLEKQAENILPFFENTGTQFRAFKKVYSRLENEKKKHNIFALLGLLLNNEGIEFIITKYQQHNITDDEIWSVQNNISHTLLLNIRSIL